MENLRTKSHPAQHGSAPGGQLARKALEFDSCAHALASKATQDDPAVMLLFDVEAALPSVCLQFMRIKSRAVALPAGLALRVSGGQAWVLAIQSARCGTAPGAHTWCTYMCLIPNSVPACGLTSPGASKPPPQRSTPYLCPANTSQARRLTNRLLHRPRNFVSLGVSRHFRNKSKCCSHMARRWPRRTRVPSRGAKRHRHCQV